MVKLVAITQPHSGTQLQQQHGYQWIDTVTSHHSGTHRGSYSDWVKKDESRPTSDQ